MSLLKDKVRIFVTKYWAILVILLVVCTFFRPFLLQGKYPIPADTIIGLYHPFRDLYADRYPNGIPFKNFLITDPVRQQYPWRQLSIDVLKEGRIPTWNPYTFGGTPLLGNHQSAPFYPLNILFFLLPFPLAWSVFILLQSLLAAFFMYFYLRTLSLEKVSSILGSIVFAFSGFSIAWLEWGTIGHTVLWLPLILLSIDKIISNQKHLKWQALFIFSLLFSLFAGHLQIFFYVFLTTLSYVAFRFWQHEKDKKFLLRIGMCLAIFLAVSAIQWIPLFQFILESGRNLEQVDWQKPGWFLPWQHLIQFVAPDFFGNPATLNYWGEWNYAEFVGYVGILPLLLAIFSFVFRKDKITLFFGTLFFVSLIFSLPTLFAKLPYIFEIPFLSTSQPTRLLFLTDFSLAVLAAFGFSFLKRKKEIIYPMIFLSFVFAFLWIFTNVTEIVSTQDILVAKRNLTLPTGLFFSSVIILAIYLFSKNKKVSFLLPFVVIIFVSFDLLRFGMKFTPFTNQEYLFPQTQTIKFLTQKQKEGELFRIMATDDRILPPNFSTVYKLQTINGYDPLYIQRYAELIAASERGEPNVDPPFGFNRIITPHRFDSKIIDLLGVKYILSLTDLSSPKLEQVFQEGQTRIYENKNALPRTFFVEKIHEVVYKRDKREAIEVLFTEDFDMKKMAVVEYEWPDGLVAKRTPRLDWSAGTTEVTDYSENRVIIQTKNTGDGFLVLTDSFYPTWKVRVDNVEGKILRTDYNFRGVIVPKGEHTIVFENNLL